MAKAKQTVTKALDTLHEARCRLSFVANVFSQPEGKPFDFTPNGQSGLYHVLADVETDMDTAIDTITTKQQEENL